jgi:group II intron reverse transcriptase/maturase
MTGAQKPESVSTKQDRIAKLARERPDLAFTSLNHYVDYEWVEYAYRCTRKDGALGVDGQSAEGYAANLQENLSRLIDRLKSGSYRAPPVRRHYIAKSDGGQRGLGIPSFEDKVAQRAVLMLLEPIYEQDFVEGSYGFRPGRNAHQALQVVRRALQKQGRCWVLDVDVRRYFASIPHARLRELLARRVTDGVVRRLIDKWLSAGVLEEGALHYPETGTPEGGVISPLLATIYLHYVVDEWHVEAVVPRLRGPSTLVRYCDDFVLLFVFEDDARRVLEVLRLRLAKYGLELHPDKTRLVDFRRARCSSPADDVDGGLPTGFNFLGFTHVWGRSWWGTLAVLQHTAKERLARSVKAINDVCRRIRHWPLREQQLRLSRMLQGHYAYYGTSGNMERLTVLYRCAGRLWRKWLMRRMRQRTFSWVRFLRLLERYPLPTPRIVHRYT